MTPASENNTIPPTLLRLPDLDPEASSMLQTVQPIAQEQVAAKPEPTSNVKASTKSGTVSRASESSSVLSEAVVSVPAANVLEGSRVAEFEPTPSEPEAVSRQELRGNLEAAEDDGLEDESDSWLSTFASRKSLLVMLAMIAALAIFFPRGDNTTSEKRTPLLVEESSPEPTVVPFQLERYPATKLAPAIASSPPQISAQNTLSDPTKVIVPTPTSQASVPLRQTVEMPTSQEVPSLASPPMSMIPQPPKTPWDDQSQPDSSVASFAPMDEALSIAQNVQGAQPLTDQGNPTNQYPQTASPQSPLIDPGSVDTLLDDTSPVQSVANTRASQTPGPTAEIPARLLNSRTPQGIDDWKKFLPPINRDSASVNGPSSPVAQSPVSQPSASQASIPQTTSQSPAAPEIRTSNSPAAPSFEFALPGGSRPAASGVTGSPAPAQTDRSGVPALTPEARVAMPPQSSLR